MSAEPEVCEDPDAFLQGLVTAAGGAPTVLLTPVTDGAVVAITPGGQCTVAAATHQLWIGSMAPASRLLMHDPPTPVELELAIEGIEDAVMPLARQIAAGSVLFVDPGSAEARWRALAAESADKRQLSINQVEALFNSLPAVAEGRPTSSSDMPGATAFAWQLLLVREAMHHWGFTVVRFAR